MGLHSQIIAPSPYEIYTNEPKFNRIFIKQNKIKTISASVVDKPDGEIIRDKGLAQVFAFDMEGNMVHQYYNEITSLEKTEIEVPAVYNKHGKVVKKSQTKIDYQYQYDTLGTEFFYSSNGYLKMKRVCIGNFYNSTYYEYFGDGLVSRQTLCKETNIAKPGEVFKLGVQTIISDEKFEYEQLTPLQVKKKFLNDEGKPYKQGILNFTDGKPIDESYEFIVGFIRSGVTYKYDAHERLTEKTMTDNSSGNNIEKITYDYDAAGNVTAEKQFKNGTQTDEIVYLYDDEKKLMTSQIDRQLQKASIKIIKYEYAFY
ncbi:MAG: RHS repeat protein [Bacteroidetes bacterium]|nr:RHS repeat protein [Bacteroidota bacterium]